MPHNAYIVECVRTPCGRRKGALSGYHPADLGAVVIDALLDRTGMDPSIVDDVVFGCVSAVGAQAGNIARTCVLSSRLPESCPGTTCDRQCGSSQQAIHQAAQAVMSGTQDVVIAGGVEVMTTCPIGSNVMDGMANGHGFPFDGEGMKKRYGEDAQFSQFKGAELLAQKYQLTRDELDAMGVRSHWRAQAASDAGRFDREVVALPGKAKDGSEVTVTRDEGIRPAATAAAFAKLKPLAGEGNGVITPGTSSQIADGAAAVLVCNDEGLRRLAAYGCRPRARVVSLALAGSCPVVMLEGPIPATRSALDKAGLSIADIDLYEVNEAFASVPASWAKAIGADHDKLNVNGGAMALGHPLGGTGAKLMTTLVNELERRGGRYGLLAICEGGGTANATIIERVGGAAEASPGAAAAARARL